MNLIKLFISCIAKPFQPSWKPGVLYNCDYLNFVAFQLCPLLPPGNLKNFNCWRTSFPRYNGSIPQCMRLQFTPQLGSCVIQMWETRIWNGNTRVLWHKWWVLQKQDSRVYMLCKVAQVCANTPVICYYYSAGYSCWIASLSLYHCCISDDVDRNCYLFAYSHFAYSRFAYFRPNSGILPTHKIFYILK